jgi:SAM-dependent methyltransferase
MRAIDANGFERKFRADIDPWDYKHSPFERFKRRIILNVCGPQKHGRVLELGCAIGETTRTLARVSLRLLAVDAAPTALVEARRQVLGKKNVTVRFAKLPFQMPRGPYDLIIASEIAYYLPQHQLKSLARRIRSALAPGGLVVVVDSKKPFGDASQLPTLAHRQLRSLLSRSTWVVFDMHLARFDVAVLAKRLPNTRVIKRSCNPQCKRKF